ncbi:N-acetyltransferase ESCO1 isoform X2 [Neoarius graeffei]|uniref:N-acetyltransferase ESCO1 isoform X2 n=1 Tax=Neoarius graeffei TaxID=443677 RepID=UPI00298C6FB1|nr:N-acetyltransferase ESCO1 isoform X2 [Neoarius graeffei]
MPCQKRKMQSTELQDNKKQVDLSSTASDKSGRPSLRPKRPRGSGVLLKKVSVKSKRKCLTQLRDEVENPLRRSSRLKIPSKKVTGVKRKKISVKSAVAKEPGCKIRIQASKKDGDKLYVTLPVLKKGSRKYTSRVKKEKCQSLLSETACTVSALLYPVLIEHSYGQPPDSHSEETTLPDKNKAGGITNFGLDLNDEHDAPVYHSVTQLSQSSETKTATKSEENALLVDPLGKITGHLDAGEGVMRESLPPRQAFSNVIQETSLNNHELNCENISDINAMVNACFLQDSLQNQVVSDASGLMQSSMTSEPLDDVEIEHCVVEIETMEDLSALDSNEQPPQDLQESAGLQETSKAVVCKESTSTPSLPQDGAKDSTQGSLAQASAEPPKKQAMNPQARTKARLAAMAKERAAATRRPPPKQLNLLALCEEIADDIASDTTAAKEKKTEECIQSSDMIQSKNEVENATIPTVSSDLPVPESLTEGILEPKVHKSTPKKRFFLSQVSVPLKTQEKKKLSRFQKLRQVELQRDKLTWTRVKKLKSDQASQDDANDSTQTSPISVSTTHASLPPHSPTPLTPTSVLKMASSECRRTLPAVAPPMPNGITSLKPRPVVEYKPYNPRPKYSPDDFELDEPSEETSKPAVPKQEDRMEQLSSLAVESSRTLGKHICIKTPPASTGIKFNQQDGSHKTPMENSEVRNRGTSGSGSDTELRNEVTNNLRTASVEGEQKNTDKNQNAFGATTCSVCGMLYSPSTTEDETQHLLFHNQFISAVRYVGWKKERILGEYPDGKIILVLPDDPKYALKKVEEIREMVDNDLGFQQVETKVPSQTKTFLFISNDKKVTGCLIAEHIQETI